MRLYQFNFIANWNWRGSYAAVGWPALQDVLLQSGLTAATLNRFTRLNISTIRSMLKRSLKLMRLATRISLKTVQGATPVLRPREPSSCSSVGLVAVRTKPRMHGSCSKPVGEYLD